MAKLDTDDWERMDRSFKGVNDRIDDVHKRVGETKDELTESISFTAKEMTDKLNAVNTDLQTTKAAPCKDVEKHEEKKHNIAKAVAIVTGILVAASTAAAVISRLVSASSPSP